jgi:drug/metabolite transporter (DMT)-like permease
LEEKAINWLEIAASIALTALCWGAYGPVLHKGQMKMGQSRLRPFLCVGLAYFVIAVVAAYFMLQKFPEPGTWNNWKGVFWSLLGGAAGAFGALGIIYAFNFGGKPIFVMPLVFGLAPVVNTFTEITTKGLQGQVSWFFFLSLLVTILGAVMVLVCAPKSHAPPAATPPVKEANA